MINSFSKDAWVICHITAEETLPIRHSVLWPNKTMNECRVEDDESGDHIGVFIDDKLVCVASVFVHELISPDSPHLALKAARLRKFATLEQHQGKGFGTFALHHIIESLQHRPVDVFWCDARESAMSLYKRFGMKAQGERFFKGDIAYQKMSVDLSFS